MNTLPAAIALPVRGTRVVLEAGTGPGSLAIRRLSGDVVVGRIVLAVSGGALHVDELVIDPEYRGFGAGSEAARLLAEAAEAAGVIRLTAWAPPDLGLAAYFWYRMGFRAVHGPGPNGGILFERVLDQVRAGTGP